jgi:hypothetical protein
MDSLITNCFKTVLYEDYTLYFKQIVKLYGNKYNFDLEDLLEKYPFPYTNLKQKLIVTRKREPIIDCLRCMARSWGGRESVYFNEKTQNWNYGNQCKNSKLKNKDYCKIHQKLVISKGLTHGRIDEDVPHCHYLKYKE